MPPKTAMSGAPDATPERRPANLMATTTATIADPIIARGLIVRSRRGAWLLVPRCPFCRGRHVHDAPAGPETREEQRVSHCADTARPYRVIVTPEGAE